MIIFGQTTLYHIITKYCACMYFRVFNFRTSQAVRKYFNNEIFAIYGELITVNHEYFVVKIP